MIARAPRIGHRLVAFFFAQKWIRIPSLSDIRFTSPAQAAFANIITDQALLTGEWPVIGRRTDWNRELWPAPPFMSWMPGSTSATRVDFDEENLSQAIDAQSFELKSNLLDRSGAWDCATIQMAIGDILAETALRPGLNYRESTANTPRRHVPETGDAFLVPLGQDRYAVGVVFDVSFSERTMVAAFFATVFGRYPTLLDLAGLRMPQALRRFACEDSRLRSGEWPFIGRPAGWRSTRRHLVPPVRHDEVALWASVANPLEGSGGKARPRKPLPYLLTQVDHDGVAGTGYVELRLMDLLYAGQALHQYAEGTWAAIPLGPPSGRRYAPVLIARVAPDATAMMGYFFATAYEEVPLLHQVATLQPDAAIEIARFDSVDLIRAPWPVIGKTADWNRSRWPVPRFLQGAPPVGHSDPKVREWSGFWGGDGIPATIEEDRSTPSPLRRAFPTDDFVRTSTIEMYLDRAIRELSRRQKLIARNKARIPPIQR